MIPPTINEKDFRYRIPPIAELIAYKRKLEQLVGIYRERLGMEEYEVEINYPLLGSIVIRVDERKDYYKYFHSTEKEVMRMSRGKEIALFAYWIVKYKPFRVKGRAAAEDFYCAYKYSFNEIFAAMSIVSFINEVTKIKEEESYFTADKINTLLYDFFSRDISKEAMIMYVESFVSGKAA